MNSIQHISKFRTNSERMTEIINLKAIMNLPKGTEHFISDLHGEYDSFQHVLRNASGSVKEKITLCFKDQLSVDEIKTFTFLVYYPEDMLQKFCDLLDDDWLEDVILKLVDLIRFVATKYTRSKVRKSLPQDFSYVTEELLYRDPTDPTKASYYKELLSEIIRLDQAQPMITGLCYAIQRLVVDHLHVVGDIFDRGPGPDQIIEELMTYHSLDIQWGNHDITWMGANSGSPLCILNVLRISARYNNLDILEDVYGINLRPLQTFAENTYEDNPSFHPKVEKNHSLSDIEHRQITQMHQAVAIMQFKLEAQLIKRRPEFKMSHRLLFDSIHFDKLDIFLKGKIFPLSHTCFQTIDPKHPDTLTEAEEKIIAHLVENFIHSEKLTRHIDFLMEKGSIYLCYNDNLLIHGCIPLNSDGSFKSLIIKEKKLRGKKLLETFEQALRTSRQNLHETEDLATDLVWYLWTGECSSLFGKNEMTTFERYFVEDAVTHKEHKNAYYRLRDDEAICLNILKEFGLNPKQGHIINGHTPVREIDGENPIKANGKMIVIDGGYSKPYQSTTGIAGYTLIYNSYGMQLVAHQPFQSKEVAIETYSDIASTKRVVDRTLTRKKVKDTNIGKVLQKEIDALEKSLKTTPTTLFD